MVFLIQSTQNRDSEAMQIKLDELIRAVGTASDRLIDVEETTDEELDELKQQYRAIAENGHVQDEENRIPAAGGRGNAAV